jgi:hypothetical protein
LEQLITQGSSAQVNSTYQGFISHYFLSYN